MFVIYIINNLSKRILVVLKITINNIRNITPKQEKMNHSHQIYDTKSIQHSQRDDSGSCYKTNCTVVKITEQKVRGGWFTLESQDY